MSEAGKPDELMDILFQNDCLRPIWRFFLCVVLFFGALVISGEIVGTFLLALGLHPTLPVLMFWQSLMSLLAVLAASKLMTVVFERRPLGSVGLAFHPRWWKELVRGLGVGAAMLSATVVLEWICGCARFTPSPHPTMRAGSFCFVLFAVAAVFEETVFRGYPFQRLIESITPTGAVIVDGAFFGFVHLANPHPTWISTLNTALVAIPMCIAYLRTHSLWMPIGMHLIWNFLMGFILGLPVSGITLPASFLTARVQGPVWLSGGDYGPEGGLLATVAILLVTVYLARAKSIYTSEEMKALVSAPERARMPETPITIFSIPPEETGKRD